MGLTPASTDRWAFTTREPIGVVVAISAFNHPLNLIVHQVAPAIAVGCPVIVKPASATPLSLHRLRGAGARSRPRRAVVPDVHHRRQRPCRAAGDRSARRLPELHRLGAGRLVAARTSSRREPARRWSMAASRLPSSTAAPISMRMIEPMVKGGYYHAGQVCVSTQRIFVHATSMPTFLDRFAARVARIASWRSASARDRGRPADPAAGGGPGRVVGRGGGGRRREGPGRRRAPSETTLEPGRPARSAAGGTGVARGSFRAGDLRLPLSRTSTRPSRARTRCRSRSRRVSSRTISTLRCMPPIASTPPR